MLTCPNNNGELIALPRFWYFKVYIWRNVSCLNRFQSFFGKKNFTPVIKWKWFSFFMNFCFRYVYFHFNRDWHISRFWKLTFSTLSIPSVTVDFLKLFFLRWLPDPFSLLRRNDTRWGRWRIVALRLCLHW